MNKNNAKALSTLRQKIRKYNRDYESEIAAYKEVISGSFLITFIVITSSSFIITVFVFVL